MASSGLEPMKAVLPNAHEPVVLPVPAGAVKVLPRWSDEDEVARWRLKYRVRQPDEAAEPADAYPRAEDERWIELELRNFTRELPLTSLACGEAHYFSVALDTSSGWSDWSRIVTCVPPAPEAPGSCAAVFAMVKDDTTAHVRWTRPIDVAAAVSCGAITDYKLLVTWTHQLNPHEDPALCRREIVISEDADCYDVPDLICQCNYQFHVAAKNVSGWGEYSDPSPVLTMPLPVPPRLPQPKLRRATHHTVVIQWQHPTASPSAPIGSFRFRYTTSKDWKSDVEEVHDVAANLSQYVIKDLRPGEVYTFQVRALNKFGMSIWSESSMPVRTLDAREPSKIKDLSVPHIYKSFITLQWPPAEENGFEVTKHLLKYAHNEDMSDAVEVNPAVLRKAGYDTCDLRHLKKTQYHFQVAAFNKMGMSEWSDPARIDLSVTAALEDAPARRALPPPTN